MSDEPVVPPPSNNLPAGDDALTPASLAPAYVFEATDPADTDAVRDAMAQSAAVGEEVQAYRRLFNAMLHSAASVPPPPALGERLLAAIQPPVTPIAQRYPGATAPVDPLEAMQVVPLITPPGGSKPVANDRVNPLTGKPMSASAPPSRPAPTATPKGAPASSAMRTLAPAPSPAQKAQTRPAPKQAPVPRATPYPPQYAATRPPAGRKAEPIPAAFALTPIAPAGGANAPGSRSALWAAWVLAIAALALLFVSNGYWVTQSGQLQQQNAQLQTDAQSAQQSATAAIDDLAAAQETIGEKEAEIAALQGSLTTAQGQLSTAQTELDTARTQAADAVAALEQVRADAGGMAISDEMVDVLVRGPMEQASLAALNDSQTMSATARILWNPDMERGMLVAMEMPPLPEGQAYQVWLLRAGVPTSVGMFTVDDAGMGMMEVNGMDLTDYEVAAITTEPMTGSQAPTGAILIAGEL